MEISLLLKKGKKMPKIEIEIINGHCYIKTQNPNEDLTLIAKSGDKKFEMPMNQRYVFLNVDSLEGLEIKIMKL